MHAGLTFGLNCLQIAGSVVALIYLDIDLTKQLATKNALICWSFLIPAHFLALALLLVFYRFCHVWKREGVVVGYAYEKDTNRDEFQQRFKGNWVTTTEEEEEQQQPIESTEV